MSTTGNLQELPGLLAELRELIREGHTVIKDMDRLLREYRQAAAEAAQQARDVTYEAGQQELSRFERHMQEQLNRQAAKINTSIMAARENVVRALIVKTMKYNTENGLEVQFSGPLYNADIPLSPLFQPEKP